MSPKNPIVIASDHAGVALKNQVIRLVNEKLGYQVKDLGTFSEDSVDYPDYGALVGKAVSTGEAERGILICGTGIGMSIIANKFPGVRAALCHNEVTARLSREHNDANVLVMGERILGTAVALDLVKVWFETPFEGGRHQRRLDKITAIEHEYENE